MTLLEQRKGRYFRGWTATRPKNSLSLPAKLLGSPPPIGIMGSPLLKGGVPMVKYWQGGNTGTASWHYPMESGGGGANKRWHPNIPPSVLLLFLFLALPFQNAPFFQGWEFIQFYFDTTCCPKPSDLAG